MATVRRGGKNTFNFFLYGHKELMDAFDQLPKAVGRAVLRRTAIKALTPVRDMARSLVSRDEGDLQESIQVSTKLSKGQKRYSNASRGTVIAYVGPSWPKGAAGILIEFGTGPRYNEAGAFRGRVTPRPFMRPAWDAKKEEVLRIMGEEIWVELAKAARSLMRRAQKGTLGRSARRALGGW